MRNEFMNVYLTDPRECPNDPGVLIRDYRVRDFCEGDKYLPCRGFSGSVAVVRDAHYIGWISVDDLPGGPFKNVAEWIAATPTAQGFPRTDRKG